MSAGFGQFSECQKSKTKTVNLPFKKLMMKKKFFLAALAFTLIVSCNKDKEILDSLNQYNTDMEAKGYHFGDKLQLPAEVTKNAESVSVSFGDRETNSLIIDPKYFALGDNAVTFVIKNKNGKVLNQDATINVFAKNPEVKLSYALVKEYPHDTRSFTEGFLLEGNTVYESIGQEGESKILKYPLGSSSATAQVAQPGDVFSEGATIIGNKLYQLTWHNKKGFIYDKNTLKLIGEFDYPNILGEGWGMTTDGKSLIVSDGTKNIYFLDPDNPGKLQRYISVAGSSKAYDQINELEYHEGFIYANVWQTPNILKIDPKTGEVIGVFDFSELAKQNTKGQDDVLNGIAFKAGNMLITGKYWPKIYEIEVK